MNTEEIIRIQNKIGTVPDGFWGRVSEKTCRDYLRSLMPKRSPWPKADTASLRAFYGMHGNEQALEVIKLKPEVEVLFEGQRVFSIRCHKKVKDSLERIINELATFEEGRIALREYAGVYNNRNKRGGTTPSLHAYGAAIDLMPNTNRNHHHWPCSSTMPLEVMEVFAKEGWLSAGAFWSRDAMHMQATQ